MEPVETVFQAWSFTQEELIGARQISADHRRYLQTLLADAAAAKLRLQCDPYKPLNFIQEEAFTTGQIELLMMLLDDSGQKVARPKPVVKQPEAS